MNFRRKIIVITGGANRLGHALASRFIDEGARVIIVDTDEMLLREIAAKTGATSVVSNYLEKKALKLLVSKVICQFGRVDLFISNTDIGRTRDFLLSQDEIAKRCERNVMAHMYVAKFVLPHMLRTGGGYFVNTIPFGGLQDEFHLPNYTTIKHPALSFAERLTETYKDSRIKVSVLCIAGVEKLKIVPSAIAGMVVNSIVKEKFMIMPAKELQKAKRKKPTYDHSKQETKSAA